MADPLSITASLLAITTAALQSAKSLYETVKRFKDRNKTLRRLQEELEHLTTILDSLAQVTSAEQSMLALLQGPVERCSQVCSEFEQTMKIFKGKSRTDLLDWTRMEFMKGDINEFIETIAGYKSTISVGLGTITMLVPDASTTLGLADCPARSHTSKISHLVLQEYDEMVRDTVYDLKLHLGRIDDKITRLGIGKTDGPSASIDLNDEREVTRQCLRICEDAKSYIESLSRGEAPFLREAHHDDDEEDGNLFEAQLRTCQTLDDNRASIVKTIGHLRQRLDILIRDDSPDKRNIRLQLEADLDTSKKCLDLCKVANEVSRQTVYRIGEVVAEGDSDQVVVTTLADLFDIKKALSKDNSAQLVGSMTAENLRYLAEKRYDSRFGRVPGRSESEASLTGTSELPVVRHLTGSHEQLSEPIARRNRPLSNEMRKRQIDGAADQRQSQSDRDTIR